MKQKIKAILDDDRGVSPVIGVILMVAITVILAAVIGTFVLGLGDSLEQAPQSQISGSDASDTVSGSQTAPAGVIDISHEGGDELAQSDYRIQVSPVEGSGTAIVYDGAVQSQDVTINGNTITLTMSGSASDFAVGDTLTIDTSTGSTDASGEYNVKIIHTPSDSIIFNSDVNVE